MNHNQRTTIVPDKILVLRVPSDWDLQTQEKFQQNIIMQLADKVVVLPENVEFEFMDHPLSVRFIYEQH